MKFQNDTLSDQKVMLKLKVFLANPLAEAANDKSDDNTLNDFFQKQSSYKHQGIINKT